MIVDCQWNDQTQAAAFYHTLSAFYAAFPSYASSDLHLIGESYAGLLLPFLTAEIYRHPDETAAKQLRGLAVGNGCPGTSGATPSNRGSCNGPYGTFDQQHVLAYCAKRGIVVEAYGALGADGLLEEPVLQQMARKYGRSPALVSLRHTLERAGERTVLLAKSLTPSRIEENLRVFEWELAPEDMRALDQLARTDGRSYWDNTDVP